MNRVDGSDDWRRLCHEGGVRHAETVDREVLAAARIAELEAEVARQKATVAAIVDSRSWRLTAPLRRVRHRRVSRGEPQAPGEDLFETRMRAAYEARAGFWQQAEPQTFNQKVWHRRLTDRRDVLHTYCDKQATREYVAARLPEEVLVPRLAAVDHPADLLDLDLPEQYVVKARHGSGGSAVVWDGPNSEGQAWVHPWIRRAYHAADAPLPRIAEDLAPCLSHDYGWDALEWGYLGVPRQLLVDTLVRGPEGGLPLDLRIYTFHGRVEVLEIASDRQREDTRYASWHDRDWNLLPIVTRLTHRPHDAPPGVAEVIEMSELLAGDDPFVRVDWLMTDEGPKFGELTPYSHGGTALFSAEWADQFLGDFW